MIETAYGGATTSLLLEIGAHRVAARVPVQRARGLWSVGDKVRVRLNADTCRLYDS